MRVYEITTFWADNVVISAGKYAKNTLLYIK